MTAINTTTGLLLWGALIYKVYKGANWARWVLAVFVVFGTIGLGVMALMPDVWKFLPPALRVSTFLQTLIQVAALVLLFLGPSSRWFRAQ